MTRVRHDLTLLGAGAAGLAVLHRLAERTGGPPVRVVVVDPRNQLEEPVADRTWCSWSRDDDPDWAWAREVARARWGAISLRDATGRRVEADLDGYSYLMISSQDYAAWVADRVASAQERGDLVVEHVDGQAEDLMQSAAGVVVKGAWGSVTSSWALDSRPPPVDAFNGARTTLLQHFYGEVRRFREPVFREDRALGRAVLMDFRPPQPAGGVAFGYVLPVDDWSALVEYTEFSHTVLTPDRYREQLAGYLELAGLSRPAEVLHQEHGVIPMTDAPLASGEGPRVFRIGTAGGATRPATGYTFAAVQRQARDLVEAWDAGRPPRPRPAYGPRARFLDAVMLRALADGSLDGAAFFPQLFASAPAPVVLRFLDGTSTPAEDLRIIRSSPAGSMVRGLVSRTTRRRARYPG